jgi:hypothetical protein
MKKIAILVSLAALLLLTSSALAQSESYSTSTSEAGARIESWATMSEASPDSALAPEGGCVPNATTLCLNGGRFQVRVTWSVPSQGTSGVGQAITLTSDTGYLWFFSSNNIELVIKVVDGRGFNNFFWVFYGALSDVSYVITITDTVTNAVRTYTNQQGTLASVADVSAFPGGTICTYTVSQPSPASFGSGGGTGTIGVTTAAGCAWSATSNAPSFITVTNPGPGSGNGSISFSVAMNTATTSRSGTITVAGEPRTISQAGMSGGGGVYDGMWSGTTAQMCSPASGARPCAVSWTIANNAFTQFSLEYAGPACGVVHGGTAITYTPPLPISGTSFTHSSSGSPPVRVSFSASGTFSSSSSASGSAAVTFTLTPPAGNCSTTVFFVFGATRM